jgi:hypothetical protein
MVMVMVIITDPVVMGMASPGKVLAGAAENSGGAEVRAGDLDDAPVWPIVFVWSTWST